MKRRCLDTLALHALMKATHLLGLALAERLRQYRESGDRVLDRFGILQEQALHVAYLREAVEIHGSRWDNKLPERQGPHYAPEARFRIVRLRTLLGLSAAETARLFRVSTTTVLRWEEEARAGSEHDTVGSLLKPVPPVRRYADVVRHLVQTMPLVGFPGDRSIALHLGRVGWKLSRRSVQRMRHEKPVQPTEAPTTERPRAVRAKYPKHVWMLDLTEIPGFLRLFSFKLAVVLDVFSRAPLAARVFFQEPSGRDIAKLLTRTARSFGPPRRSVSDQGAQLKSDAFRDALARLGIKQRYGAIGRTGSIAIIERFFRTLKTTARLCWRPPFLRRDLEHRLALAFRYYLWLRPHQRLAGATPGEIYLGRKPAPAAVPLPRGRPGERHAVSVVPEVRYLDPDRRLPDLVRKAA
jgi:transposase InsO family protein